VVEFAPYQKVPRTGRANKKPDPKLATIENDPDYQKFAATLEEAKPATLTIDQQLEGIDQKEKERGKQAMEKESVVYLHFPFQP